MSNFGVQMLCLVDKVGLPCGDSETIYFYNLNYVIFVKSLTKLPILSWQNYSITSFKEEERVIIKVENTDILSAKLIKIY